MKKSIIMTSLFLCVLLLSACTTKTSTGGNVDLGEENANIIGQLAEQHYDEIVMGGAYEYVAKNIEIQDADYFGRYLIYMSGNITPTWSNKKTEQDAWVILSNIDFENKTYDYIEGNSGTDSVENLSLMKYRNNWGLEAGDLLPEQSIYEAWCLAGVPVYGYESFISYGKHTLIYESGLSVTEINEKYHFLFSGYDSYQRLSEAMYSVELNGFDSVVTFEIFEPAHWYEELMHQSFDEASNTAKSIVKISLS